MRDGPALAGFESEFANQTSICPLGLTLVVVLGLATLFVPTVEQFRFEHHPC